MSSESKFCPATLRVEPFVSLPPEPFVSLPPEPFVSIPPGPTDFHSATHLELHRGELVHCLGHGLPDDVPGDLVVGLRGRLHRVASQLVEGDHVLQHADRLVEGTEPIVRCVAAGQRRTSGQSGGQRRSKLKISTKVVLTAVV